MTNPPFPPYGFLCVVSAAYDDLFRCAPALGSGAYQMLTAGRVTTVVTQTQWPVERALEDE